MTKTFYRVANISVDEALQALKTGFPNAKVVGFTTKKASPFEARAARTKPGVTVYAAELEIEVDDEEDTDTEDLAPKDAPKVPKPQKSEKDNGGDEESNDENGDDVKSMLKELLSLVKDLVGEDKGEDMDMDLGLDAVPGDPTLEPGGPGDLPDIGAPSAGAQPPLPPPAKKPGAPAAFSHYNPKVKTFTVLREDAGALGTRSLIAEAQKVYPTHRVAKVKRQGNDATLVMVAR